MTEPSEPTQDPIGTASTFEHLTPERLKAVAETRDREPVIALLKRLEKSSAPQSGAVKLLLLVSVMARSCRWLPGPLYVELKRSQDTTIVSLMIDAGVHFEKLCEQLTLMAPLDEFVESIQRMNAHSKSPLRIRRTTEHEGVVHKFCLDMVIQVRAQTEPPPDIRVRSERAHMVHDPLPPPQTPADFMGRQRQRTPMSPNHEMPGIALPKPTPSPPSNGAPVSTAMPSAGPATDDIDADW